MNRIRTSLLWLHWGGGLLALLYAVVIGLTGAALVFRDELKEWEHPEIHRGRVHEGRVTATDALALARRTYSDWRVLSINFPNAETPVWMAYLLKGTQAREAYISPDTGEFLAVVDPRGGLSGQLADLHFNLLSGRTGRLVSGYAALLLIFLCLTGLVLWLPRTGAGLGRQLKARLRIDASAGFQGLSWQLHHSLGALSWLFLMTLAVSGVYFAWPGPFVDFTRRYLGRSAEPVVPAHPPGAALLPMADLGRKAYQALPGLPIQRIQVVTRGDQPVRVTMREGTPAEFHLVSTVFLDPVTGDVLARHRMTERPIGDKFLSWMSAVHFGVFGGWPVRGLWVVLGSSLPVLAGSGVTLWLARKRRR